MDSAIAPSSDVKLDDIVGDYQRMVQKLMKKLTYARNRIRTNSRLNTRKGYSKENLNQQNNQSNNSEEQSDTTEDICQELIKTLKYVKCVTRRIVALEKLMRAKFLENSNFGDSFPDFSTFITANDFKQEISRLEGLIDGAALKSPLLKEPLREVLAKRQFGFSSSEESVAAMVKAMPESNVERKIKICDLNRRMSTKMSHCERIVQISSTNRETSTSVFNVSSILVMCKGIVLTLNLFFLTSLESISLEGALILGGIVLFLLGFLFRLF